MQPSTLLPLLAALTSSSQDCRCPNNTPRGTIALTALAPTSDTHAALAAQCADGAVKAARASSPFEPFYGQARAAAQQHVFHLTAKHASFSEDDLPMLPAGASAAKAAVLRAIRAAAAAREAVRWVMAILR